ncbi:MAG: hypothetical protein DRH08_06780 [Deltaproteobacteria bacterium]|nr:MAG: hypothetical protein DRR42_13205 [Gammaproteobacteria bacterium]RLB66217.1 MAG: hypothetical protein DRH08_06780 [Deltaproteobacteria bacterium]
MALDKMFAEFLQNGLSGSFPGFDLCPVTGRGFGNLKLLTALTQRNVRDAQFPRYLLGGALPYEQEKLFAGQFFIHGGWFLWRESEDCIIDTIQRFKGLESAVVILWGLDGLDLKASEELI